MKFWRKEYGIHHGGYTLDVIKGSTGVKQLHFLSGKTRISPPSVKNFMVVVVPEIESTKIR